MEYLIQNGELSIMQKLEILTDAAKYDVACTSSGVERKGDGELHEGRDLSQLFFGWQMHFFVEDSDDQ